jgi:hypothetical protein
VEEVRNARADAHNARNIKKSQALRAGSPGLEGRQNKRAALPSMYYEKEGVLPATFEPRATVLL